MRGADQLCTRRGAAVLLAAACGRLAPQRSLAGEVAKRTEQEALAQMLYSPLPEVQPFRQQLSDAIPVKTLRGVWSLREYDANGRLCAEGRLTFRGAETEDRGQVVYEGDQVLYEGGQSVRYRTSGRGPWILKPDGFGRNPNGQGGIIESKALFKLRRGAQGTYTFASRVSVRAGSPFSVEGDVVQLINGGKPKGGSERKVGRFVGEFERALSPAEEVAATDSAASGGAPEALRVVCTATNIGGAVVSCQ